MSKWVVILALSLVIGIYGLGGIVFSTAGVAEILFCLFLIMFVAVMLIGFLSIDTLNRKQPERRENRNEPRGRSMQWSPRKV